MWETQNAAARNSDGPSNEVKSLGEPMLSDEELIRELRDLVGEGADPMLRRQRRTPSGDSN